MLTLKRQQIPDHLMQFFQPTPPLKRKNDCLIPHRFALACQSEGWIVRSDIVWSKKNCMPESVTDRPTKAHEYLFLMSKSQRYFYDADAVREELSPTAHYGGTYKTSGKLDASRNDHGSINAGTILPNPAGRNKRTVWTVSTKPYPKSHFAVFPPDLIEPCILAGTSAHGVCAECGAPHERVVEKESINPWHERKANGASNGSKERGYNENHGEGMSHTLGVKTTTTGWQPTCDCDADTVPATVLDPFNGSGTTGMVARQHGRHYIGGDISDEYHKLAYERIFDAAHEDARQFKPLTGKSTHDDLPLFAEVA